MWGKFGLDNVMVLLFHSQGQEDTLEGGVNSSRWNLFDKSMESVEMKDG